MVFRGKYGELYLASPNHKVSEHYMIPAKYAKTYEDAVEYIEASFENNLAYRRRLIAQIYAYFVKGMESYDLTHPTIDIQKAFKDFVLKYAEEQKKKGREPVFLKTSVLRNMFLMLYDEHKHRHPQSKPLPEYAFAFTPHNAGHIMGQLKKEGILQKYSDGVYTFSGVNK